MLILTTLQKLLKSHEKKVIHEKVTEKFSFCFYYPVQKFSANNFFGWFFYTFFN